MIPRQTPYMATTPLAAQAPVVNPALTAGPVAPDFAAMAQERAKLQRRQAIAEAMMSGAMTPDQGEMVSGWYVGPGLVGAASKLGTAFLGSKTADKGDEREAELTSRETAARQQIIAALTQNPELASQYMSTGDKVTDALAGNIWTEQRKNNMIPLKDKLGWRKDYTEQSIADYEAGNGPLVPRDKPVREVMRDGDRYMELADGSLKKLDNAPSTTVTVHGEKGQTEFEKALGKKAAEEMQASAQFASSAQIGLDAANQLDSAIQAGAFTGTFASVQDWLTRFGNTIAPNATSDQKLAAGKQLVSQLAQLTLEGRKQMRGQGAVTEAEGKLAQDAESGTRTLSEAEIRQLVYAARRAGQHFLTVHNKRMEGLRKNPALSGFIDIFDTPSVSSSQLPGQESATTVGQPGAPPASERPPTRIRYDAEGNQIR